MSFTSDHTWYNAFWSAHSEGSSASPGGHARHAARQVNGRAAGRSGDTTTQASWLRLPPARHPAAPILASAPRRGGLSLGGRHRGEEEAVLFGGATDDFTLFTDPRRLSERGPLSIRHAIEIDDVGLGGP
jgi:hypothetical protein